MNTDQNKAWIRLTQDWEQQAHRDYANKYQNIAAGLFAAAITLLVVGGWVVYTLIH